MIAKKFEEGYRDSKIVDDYDRKRFTSRHGKLYDELQREWVVKLLDPQENDIVLDAGAGTGRFSLELFAHCFYTYALDSSRPMLDKLKEKQPYIKTFEGSVLSMPFDSHSFNKLNCMLVLRHFSDEDIKKALREFYRVLKKGRVLTFDMPNQRFVGLTERFKKRSEHNYTIDRGMYVSQVEALVKECGFKVEEKKFLYKCPISILSWLLKIYDFSNLMKWYENKFNFGMQVIYKCRRM